MSRVGAQQPVQRGGAGARQAGDEDGPLDRDVGVLWILLPRRLRQQPSNQRIAHEEPRHLAAQLGEARLARIRVEQNAERLAVVVVFDAEVVESASLRCRGV